MWYTLSMATRKGCKTIKGTDLKVGDKSLGFGTIGKVVSGQLEAGAKYRDATFDDGSTHRCWEAFKYHVECDIVLNLENATPRELREML